MDEMKETIAKNLVQLRTQARLTQLQIADMLNYSDKAVSKWERGEAIPDIRVLSQLASIYNITVDDIINPAAHEVVKPKMNTVKKRILITLLSVGLVWFVATALFTLFFLITATEKCAYLSFVCAPLAMSIVLMVFSAKWGNWITNTVASSMIVWTAVLIFHIFVRQFAPGFDKIVYLYIAAGVFEILIILWFVLRHYINAKHRRK